MPSLTFGHGAAINCCRAQTRKATHTGLKLFQVTCAKQGGGVYKGASCPTSFNPVDESRSLGVTCCTRPVLPPPLPPAPGAPRTLEQFRDVCTTRGGIIWNNCKAEQVTLMEKESFPNGVNKVCCGDPKQINRDMYKQFVRKCFAQQGIVYANRGCPVSANVVIPQARFGVLEPVVCCK